jgi:hypothetical protein
MFSKGTAAEGENYGSFFFLTWFDVIFMVLDVFVTEVVRFSICNN